MKNEKIIIAIDFDGVLSDFSSGWIGTRDISDPPSPGAIKWLRHLLYPEHLFKVAIYSARNHCWGGRRAIKKWLLQNGLTRREITKISFPWLKPPCTFLLDDRVMLFKGKFPTDIEILSFRPWHGKGVW
jgi:hypothetical protein